MRRALITLVVGTLVVSAMATPAAADTELSITDVSLPATVTQGDSFELRVSVSGDNLQNNQVDVSLTLPSGLSCSPSGTQTATLTSGTGEVVFDCTADVDGDYQGEITVRASASAQSGSDPTPKTTQSGLTVQSPASLTLASSLDATSIDEGSSTTLTAVVHNAGDAETSYSLSLSAGSGLSTSRSSGSTSGTIAGGTTKSVDYTITGDASGTYTVTTDLTGNGQALSEDEQLSVESTGSTFVPTPSIQLETTALEYGDVIVNESQDKTFAVSNTGSADLSVSSISLDGADSSAFAATPSSFSVAPDGETAVTVTFEPSTAGDATADLTVESNAGSETVSLSGTGVAGSLTANTTDLSFGNVSLGETVTRDVTISNDGEASVSLANVSLTSGATDEFSLGGTPGSLSPGASATIPVTYAPTTTGDATATLVAESASSGRVSISLSGTGVVPNATVEPSTLDFASVPVGGSVTRELTVHNDGAGILRVHDLNVSGASPDSFIVDSPSAVVQPGENATLDVTFRPVTSGSVSATLALNTTDPDDPQPITLSGTGTTANLSVTPLALDFGSQRAGTVATRQVTVQNNGTRTVRLENVTTNGRQFGVPNATVWVLEPGTNRTLTVRYAPETAGTHTGTLVVGTNDTRLSSVTVSLQGNSTAPDVQVSPEALKFGNVSLNETVTEDLTVSNPGTALLNVSGASFSGTGRDVYSVRDSTPVTVPAGENRSVTVAFTPDRARTFSGTLNLDTNVPDRSTVPVWVSNSDTTVDIDVAADNESQQLNATVENVSAGESVTVNTSAGATDQSVSVNTVSVTTSTDTDFTLNMTSQDEPPETAPEFNTSTGTEPLEYINVSHSVSNDNISQASMTTRIARSTIAEMASTDPEDVALYRYENGSWTEKPTSIDRRTDSHVVYNVSASGFSEWTAGAKQAQFELVQADVNVSTLQTGENVAVQVRISNTGGADGEFQTDLLFNDEIVESRSIEISAGGTAQTTFERSFTQAGTYTIQVNQVTAGTVTVQEANTTDGSQAATTTGSAETTSGSGPTTPLLAVLAIVVFAGGLLTSRYRAEE